MDVNPAESALLELKVAAIKHLSYEDYLLVLGDKEDTMQKRCRMIIIITVLIAIWLAINLATLGE